jgi:hypothetical protein
MVLDFCELCQKQMKMLMSFLNVRIHQKTINLQAKSISLALTFQILLILFDSHEPIGKQILLFQF